MSKEKRYWLDRLVVVYGVGLNGSMSLNLKLPKECGPNCEGLSMALVW